MLRVALSLSTLYGIPIEIENIRAGRPKPGLAAQHLKGNAIAEFNILCFNCAGCRKLNSLLLQVWNLSRKCVMHKSEVDT